MSNPREEIRTLRRDLAAALREHTSVTDYVPLADRALVLPLKEGEEIERRGSLYVPAKGKEARHARALVVAVGPGKYAKRTGRRVPPDFGPGDVVIVGNWIGERVEDLDDEYRLVRIGDVLAVLEE